jgi:hypothetical protein
MDEADAVQYLMMLSRDEEDARRAAEAGNGHGHEGEGDAESPVTEEEYGSPTRSNSKGVYGSPTNSTRSTIPSVSSSPSSKRSGPSVYIPTNGRPCTSVGDIPDASPSRSPYGSYQSGRSYRGGGESDLLDEDEELRMVLELSLLEQ